MQKCLNIYLLLKTYLQLHNTIIFWMKKNYEGRKINSDREEFSVISSTNELGINHCFNLHQSVTLYYVINSFCKKIAFETVVQHSKALNYHFRLH